MNLWGEIQRIIIIILSGVALLYIVWGLRCMFNLGG